jgi:hypothetical protein
MAMSATMTVPSNVIAGRPMVAMLTISNTGGSDVTVTSIQALVTTAGPALGTPVYNFQEPTFPPNKSKTVTASGSLIVPMPIVFLAPQTVGPANTVPGSTYLLDALITVSDGTVCTVTYPQWVSVSSGAPSPSQGYGQFRFDDGRNLINIAVL